MQKVYLILSYEAGFTYAYNVKTNQRVRQQAAVKIVEGMGNFVDPANPDQIMAHEMQEAVWLGESAFRVGHKAVDEAVAAIGFRKMPMN